MYKILTVNVQMFIVVTLSLSSSLSSSQYNIDLWLKCHFRFSIFSFISIYGVYVVCVTLTYRKSNTNDDRMTHIHETYRKPSMLHFTFMKTEQFQVSKYAVYNIYTLWLQLHRQPTLTSLRSCSYTRNFWDWSLSGNEVLDFFKLC